MIGRDSFSMRASLRDRSGVIAEFKRRSPSKQVINQKNSVDEVVQGYESAGASGISVLTDTKYFGGSLDDLLQARGTLEINPPIRIGSLERLQGGRPYCGKLARDPDTSPSTAIMNTSLHLTPRGHLTELPTPFPHTHVI